MAFLLPRRGDEGVLRLSAADVSAPLSALTAYPFPSAVDRPTPALNTCRVDTAAFLADG